MLTDFHFLIAEDDLRDARRCETLLRQAMQQLAWAQDAELKLERVASVHAGLRWLREAPSTERFFLLLDWQLSDGDAGELLRGARSVVARSEGLIIMTNHFVELRALRIKERLPSELHLAPRSVDVIAKGGDFAVKFPEAVLRMLGESAAYSREVSRLDRELDDVEGAVDEIELLVAEGGPESRAASYLVTEAVGRLLGRGDLRECARLLRMMRPEACGAYAVAAALARTKDVCARDERLAAAYDALLKRLLAALPEPDRRGLRCVLAREADGGGA